MPSLETKAGSGPIPGSADKRDSSEGGDDFSLAVLNLSSQRNENEGWSVCSLFTM